MHLRAVQPPLGAGQQQVQHLTAKAHHQALTLRVAEADVVFNQAGCAILDHQADEQDAAHRRAAPDHLDHRRTHDFIERAGLDLWRHDRGRGIGAHAAGVRPGVAVADPLVVLRGAERQDRFAVYKAEKTGLFAAQEGFYHHLGLAVDAAEDIGQCALSLLDGGSDGDAFARGQPIGLDDDGERLIRQIGPGRLQIVEPAIGRGGRIHGGADFLGEGL